MPEEERAARFTVQQGGDIRGRESTEGPAEHRGLTESFDVISSNIGTRDDKRGRIATVKQHGLAWGGVITGDREDDVVLLQSTQERR